jgi:Fic family protein
MTKMKPDIHAIINHLKEYPDLSSKEIYDHVGEGMISYPTMKRMLAAYLAKGYLEARGNGKSTKYHVSAMYDVVRSIQPEDYFRQDIDQRTIKRAYNHQLIRSTLNKINLFSVEEIQYLLTLQEKFKEKVAALNKAEYQAELERLAIDLSWKSAQIEGNTYSLLETERLLKYKQTADGKTKDEAVMLLNHKEAIDFIVKDTDYLRPIRVSAIEDIHSILIKELGVDRNIRKRSVGISGTNYRPLDNDFQIKEAMEEMCGLVNLKENVFEKAMLVLLLISYIQPFNDGNKRTARIISNAILMGNHYCPISFRTVDSLEYKKAMLIFYEQNNVSAFKEIFISQFEFAVNTYF